MRICPVCGNAIWKTVYKIASWEVGECHTCRFARIDPLPNTESRASFYSQEEIAKRCVTKKKSLARRFSRGMKQFSTRLMNQNKVKSEVFYAKLLRCLKPGEAVLDVGCGDGAFLKLAQKRFVSTGIEISEHLASLAGKENGLEVLCGDFLTMDFKDRKFNALTLISILEHLNDPYQALKKCFSLLYPDGILLIKTVNYGCLNRRIKKESWNGLRPPDHVVYFDPSNLRRLLSAIGFKKIKIASWPFNDNMYCDAVL